MECFRRADALVMPSPSSFSALPMALMDETAPALKMYPEDTPLGEGDGLLEQLVRQPWYKKRVFDGSRLKEFVEAAAAAASRPLRDLDAAEANRYRKLNSVCCTQLTCRRGRRLVAARNSIETTGKMIPVGTDLHRPVVHRSPIGANLAC